MSVETAPSRHWYKILATLTRLIVGVCVTGVEALFTHVKPGSPEVWFSPHA
jgi:hypothetical protein